MRSAARLLGYFVVAVAVISLVAAVVAAVFDLDPVTTISLAFIGAGAALGGLVLYSGPGAPPPDIPGLEREYLRHVHHGSAAERRAWQRENLLLIAAAFVLVVIGAAIGLLG